jgi:hypothetical protein
MISEAREERSQEEADEEEEDDDEDEVEEIVGEGHRVKDDRRICEVIVQREEEGKVVEVDCWSSRS